MSGVRRQAALAAAVDRLACSRGREPGARRGRAARARLRARAQDAVPDRHRRGRARRALRRAHRASCRPRAAAAPDGRCVLPTRRAGRRAGCLRAATGDRAARGWAIEHATAILADGRTPVVVDLCTGSGAIAKSLADEVPDADVHAVELDEDAHRWAERNLAGTDVDLRQGDMGSRSTTCSAPWTWWSAIRRTSRSRPGSRSRSRRVTTTPTWRSSPATTGSMRSACWPIAPPLLLRPGGVVGAEHADAQGESAPAVFAATGRWVEIVDHRDLAGRPRFTTARLAR